MAYRCPVRSLISILCTSILFIPLLGLATGRPGPAEPVSLLVDGPGRMVLGGNLLDGPYRLAIVNGSLAVNGLVIPKPPRRALPPPPPVRSNDLAAANAMIALCDSLRGAGAGQALIVTRLREYALPGQLASSIEPVAGDIRIRFRSGWSIRIPARAPEHLEGPRPPAPSRAEREMATLQELQGFLKTGGVVFVVSDEAQYVVSPENARAALAALSQLRRGEYSDKSYRFPDMVRPQLLKPIRLVRVP
jgi:hypothetical protein